MQPPSATMEAMACTIVHCRAAHWPTQPPRRHRRRRCLGPTRAGLLDMFKGGGAAPQLDVDAEGEQLKEWMIQRGLPPQQVGRAEGE